MDAARSEHPVPGRLAVEVGVDVDEARRDRQPVRVDLPATATGQPRFDRGDDPAVDGDIGEAWRRTRPVDHHAVADHQLVLTHASSLALETCPRATGQAVDQRRPYGRESPGVVGYPAVSAMSQSTTSANEPRLAYRER